MYMIGTQGQTMTITGATAGVGKSFVAANLGALLAIDDKKVVIIDADLRRARLGEYFGDDCKRPGLSDVLLRSEEHTSELQSRGHLICRLLLATKNTWRPSLTDVQ